jgi:hypothetical protein
VTKDDVNNNNNNIIIISSSSSSNSIVIVVVVVVVDHSMTYTASRRPLTSLVPRPVRVGSVTDKFALLQVLPSYSVCDVVVVPPVFHADHFIHHPRYIILEIERTLK